MGSTPTPATIKDGWQSGLLHNVPKNKICVENNELFINILDILESDEIIFKIIR